MVATEAAIESAQASIERIEIDIADSTLRAPRGGRVLYRLAEPGEVLGVGGKVLTLLDLADVYMVIFLPAPAAGWVPLGAAARLVLDAAPEYVIPAEVSFVAPRAQFTPKQVETQSVREQLCLPRQGAHRAGPARALRAPSSRPVSPASPTSRSGPRRLGPST